MNTIKIKDSNQLVRSACEDLQAVRAMVLTADDHPRYTREQEILAVVGRALGPIIDDLKEAASAFDEELESVQQN